MSEAPQTQPSNHRIEGGIIGRGGRSGILGAFLHNRTDHTTPFLIAKPTDPLIDVATSSTSTAAAAAPALTVSGYFLQGRHFSGGG